jgi:hypothetical protein
MGDGWLNEIIECGNGEKWKAYEALQERMKPTICFDQLYTPLYLNLTVSFRFWCHVITISTRLLIPPVLIDNDYTRSFPARRPILWSWLCQ